MIEEYELSIIRRYYPQEEVEIINPNGYINQNNNRVYAIVARTKLIYPLSM